MAKLLNSWIGYVDRSYEQIKKAFIEKLPFKNPELTDLSETNPLVIFADFVAGTIEMLNLYIDNMARESFLVSARRLSSVLKLVRILDYHIKARYPESVDLTIKFRDGSNPYTLIGQYIIPEGSIFTANGITYITLDQVIVASGKTEVTIKVQQVQIITSQVLGLTNTEPDQFFSIGTTYVHGSMSLLIGSDLWNLRNTFGLSNSTSRDFLVDIGEDGIAKIVLGDGAKGAIPDGGETLIGTYKTTLGPAGKVQPNQSWLFENTYPSNEEIPSLQIINVQGSSGGAEYETIERIRINAPKSIRTLDRAVTYQDYLDITNMHPGVIKTGIKHCCGRYFDVFIVPNGGGFASTQLVQEVQEYLNDRKIITTKPTVKSAGVSEMYIRLEVMPRFRRNPIEVSTDVKTALIDYGSVENQDVNPLLKISDVIALIDNLDKVEYVDVQEFYIKPYARPENSSSIPLVWNPRVLVGSTMTVNWKLTYDGLLFKLYRNGAFINTIPIDSEYVLPEFKFTISTGLYELGMAWTFTTYPFLKNVTLTDYTIPTIKESDIDLTVLQRLSQNLNPKNLC